MTHRARPPLRLLAGWPAHLGGGFLVAAVVLTFAGCAALPALLGLTSAVAPVAVAAIDAYAENARAIAPNASNADVAMLADLLRKRDECTVTASAVLMPDAGAPADARDKALEDSAAATRALLDAVRALTAATVVDAGKEGGGA